MKEFVLLFRQPSLDHPERSEEQIAEMNRKWKIWIDAMVAEGRISGGQRLGPEGKVLKAAGVTTDGPFVEIKEKLGGFIAIKAESLEDAVTFAHGCPAIDEGGSVEVRPVYGQTKA